MTVCRHPGTPCIFWDHLFDPQLRQQVLDLIQVRKRFGINYKSEVKIRKAYNVRHRGCVVQDASQLSSGADCSILWVAGPVCGHY